MSFLAPGQRSATSSGNSSCTAEWSAISGAGPANALPPNGRYIRPINSKMMTTTTTRPTRPLGNIPSRRYKAKSAVNQSKSGSE